MQSLQEVANQLKSLKSASIFTHMRPDGDALGSAMALCYGLRSLGVEVEVCDETEVPESFNFFPEMKEIKKMPALDCEAYICLDSSDENRLGQLCNVFLQGAKKKRTFNIDHHISNTLYAKVNYVKNCSATCQIMTLLLEQMGVEITQQIANFLTVGLLTDSGNFSHSDVTEETFLVASKLAKAKAQFSEINYTMFKRQKKERAALYAKTMSGMRFALDNRLAMIIVTQKNIQECNANASMTEGFVDFPLSIDGVEVAVCLMEVKDKQYKLSLRSKGTANVNEIASVYGGGGHILASGCMMFGEIEEIIDKLTYTVFQHI